jgi:hypothetical protein
LLFYVTVQFGSRSKEITKIGGVSESSVPRNKTSTVVKNNGIKSQKQEFDILFHNLVLKCKSMRSEE